MTFIPTPNHLPDPDLYALEAVYKIAMSERQFEITQLVQRNNFFMIFQGVLLAGLIQAAGNGKIIPIISLMLVLAGLLTAIWQIGMAAGAKFWQERWELAVNKIESDLIESHRVNGRKKLHLLFTVEDATIEKEVGKRVHGTFVGHLIALRFSPSRLPIYVGITFLIVWLVLLVSQFGLGSSHNFPIELTGFNKCEPCEKK